MGALLFCLVYGLGTAFFSEVVGTQFSFAGVFAATLITATIFSAADFCVYLIEKPLFRVARALLKARELGALIVVLFMFAVVGGLTGSVIYAWAHLAPVSFENPPLETYQAFRLGFSAALFDGILSAIGLPNRFTSLCQLADRCNPRD